jgi:hypothetical protein
MALDLDDPVAVALATVAAFQQAGLEGALYGGLALAAFGEPRETRDADFAVSTASAADARAALAAAGLDTVVALPGVRFGGLEISRISLAGGRKFNTIHLVTPRSPRYAQAVLRRAMEGTLEGQTLRVVTPEDFILLKVLSTREHDLVDARTVVEALRDRLDLALMEQEHIALAAEIQDHEIGVRYATVIG